MLLGVATAAIVANGWLVNAPALYFGHVVDAVAGNGVLGLATVKRLLLLIIAAIAGRELTILVRKLCVEWVATSFEKTQLVKVISHLVFLDILAENLSSGQLQQRVDKSVEGAVKLLKLTLLDFGPAFTGAAWAVALGFSAHVGAGTIMLCTGALATALTLWQVKSQAGIRVGLKRAKENLAGNTVELLQSLDYVQATSAAEYEIRASGQLAEGLRSQEYRHHRYMMSFDTAKQLTEGLGYVAIVAFGAWLIINKAASAGDVLKFALLFGAVAVPLHDLHRIIDEGSEAALGVNDLAGLHALAQGPAAKRDGRPPDPNSGIVADIHGVSLRSRPREACQPPLQLLKDVSLCVRQGETVGCAGESGSGKSMISRVMLGVLKPDSGDVRVFGQNAAEVDRHRLADLVGYVSQSPFLIAGSLRENLLLSANSTPSDEHLVKALRMAECQELLHRDPKGLDMHISEGGKNLSGGQRQRIAIARLFVHQPRFAVLDEATSGLDSNTEEKVMNSIAALRPQTTLFIVAHRLSTLGIADRILVLQEGSIVQEGTFDELMAQEGTFRLMAQKQILAQSSHLQSQSANMPAESA